jgi:methylated-DNA-[protein]-cysteine S-methyltransferase
MTGAPGFTLFDTAIGSCAIAWTDRGIAALQLPERDDTATTARLLQLCPGALVAAPPPAIAEAIAAVRRLLLGEPQDLSRLPLDLQGVPRFHRAVYGVALGIPPGAVMTYGAIAAQLGDKGAARAVGQALGRNPIAIIIPCHRVVAAGGAIGGFSARGGALTKQRILAIEGARTVAQTGLFSP